uniref:AMPK1_CBM domain-containing protein n=1 Tax=Steinernema glaseri TaxID=37863 RepID=A0A1I7ZX61_9BILA
MEGIEDMREAQKKAQEARKALLLYEPWMDHKVKSPSIREYVESPGVFPAIGPKSQFKFDPDYLKNVSKTPTPVAAPTPPPTKGELQQVPVAIRTTYATAPHPVAMQPLSPPVSPTEKVVKKSNFYDFYAWLWNGREDDIEHSLIEKMLFKTRPSRSKNLQRVSPADGRPQCFGNGRFQRLLHRTTVP